MKAVAAFLILIGLFAGSYVNAGWIDKHGNTLPDSDDQKSIGNFGAQLIFTTDEAALLKKWATPSETVDLNTVESVSINQPISAFIIFGGCEPVAGKCNVSMRFRIIQPDGKVYSETPAMEVWHNKPVPPSRSLELSVQYLKVVVEPHEQQGCYLVQAQVRDDNTGQILFLQKAFKAVSASAQDKHNNAVQRASPDGPSADLNR